MKRTLDRVGIRLRRFAALAIAPGALCSHRRPEVLQWQSTGVMPLSLRLHLRRCRRCRTEQRQAILGARSAILPLAPVASLPATATGALARLYHVVVGHPSVVRSNDFVARIRKAAPVGGGGAALAAKLAATTAVVTAGAALHAVSANPPPTRSAHRHDRVVRVHARRAHRATEVTAAATPAMTVAKPSPLPLRAPTSRSRSTTTQSSASGVATTTKPPPAPSQNTAAPAPVAYHATSGSSAHAARDATSSSPPAPVSAASGESASSSRSDTRSGPAPPGGPPPP